MPIQTFLLFERNSAKEAFSYYAQKESLQEIGLQLSENQFYSH
jgi:hypothetical protein